MTVTLNILNSKFLQIFSFFCLVLVILETPQSSSKYCNFFSWITLNWDVFHCQTIPILSSSQTEHLPPRDSTICYTHKFLTTSCPILTHYFSQCIRRALLSVRASSMYPHVYKQVNYAIHLMRRPRMED